MYLCVEPLQQEFLVPVHSFKFATDGILADLIHHELQDTGQGMNQYNGTSTIHDCRFQGYWCIQRELILIILIPCIACLPVIIIYLHVGCHG